MELFKMPNFEDFGLSAPVLRALREMGFEEPTPVQTRAMPPLLAGRDVVAQALTGTGKTAAYGVPLVEHIDPSLRFIQAVVLSPTRELAIQVEEHLSLLAKYRSLRFLAVYGGQPIDRQLRALSRGVHGIVATPGRLMDHMRRGTVKLDNVRVLVLDEADQMLQMGFQEDVEFVLSKLPKERLTALFSATMPASIMKIVDRYMNDSEKIHLSHAQALTVPSVDQVFFQVPFPRKFDALCSVLDARPVDRTMVFCSTKRMVDEVAERLPMRGYSAQAIHGDVTQSGRERALKAFRDGRTDVLIATDVAARGLDVPDVSLVVNFDIPPDPEYYVHRIGRTGRSGKSGEAITFVNPREMRELKMIERATGAHIRRGELPTSRETEERAGQQLEGKLREALKGTGWKRYVEMVDNLSSEHDALEIAAAALTLVSERGAPRRLHARPEPSNPRPVESAEVGADSQPSRSRPVHQHAKHSTGERHWKPGKPSARKASGYKGKPGKQPIRRDR
jgi:ATP-dependent RNA helicase DeaD